MANLKPTAKPAEKTTKTAAPMARIEGQSLIITLPIELMPRLTEKGNLTIASTFGIKPCGVMMPNGEPLMLGVNAFHKA